MSPARFFPIFVIPLFSLDVTGPGLRISAMSYAVAFHLCEQLLSYQASVAGKSRGVTMDFDNRHKMGIFQNMNWFWVPALGQGHVDPGQSKVSLTETW